jgi:hypothetical protein
MAKMSSSQPSCRLAHLSAFVDVWFIAYLSFFMSACFFHCYLSASMLVYYFNIFAFLFTLLPVKPPCLSVFLHVCLSVFLHVCLSVYLLPVSLRARLSAYMSACLFLHETCLPRYLAVFYALPYYLPVTCLCPFLSVVLYAVLSVYLVSVYNMLVSH